MGYINNLHKEHASGTARGDNREFHDKQDDRPAIRYVPAG